MIVKGWPCSQQASQGLTAHAAQKEEEEEQGGQPYNWEQLAFAQFTVDLFKSGNNIFISNSFFSFLSTRVGMIKKSVAYPYWRSQANPLNLLHLPQGLMVFLF